IPILSSIPFFAAAFRQNLNEHNTKLSSNSFKAMMEFIYLNKTSHFDVSHSLELLDPLNGAQFYFSDKNHPFCFLSKIKNINEQNAVKVFILSSKKNENSIKEEANKIINNNP